MPEQQWVSELLRAAVRGDWCVRIGCSTCGATEFCGAIERHLCSDWPSVEEPNPSPLFEERRVRSIGNNKLILQLAGFEPPAADLSFRAHRGHKWREAMEGLLVFAWYRLDGEEARTRMREALSGSFAGSVLESMILEYEEKQAQRAERQSENSPERRRQRMAQRQDAHKDRLLRKAIRDASLTEIGIARYGEDVSRSEMFSRLITDGVFVGPA